MLGYAEPGAFGVVTIGMTTDQARATGFIEPDAERGDVCDSPAGWWKWRGELSEGLDVYADDRGRIVTMADRKGGIETREGIAVGNSLGAVNDTYGAVVSPAQEAGYNQSGVFIERDGKWLGFLFDASYSEVNESSRVTMIEVTEGHRPELMRDGC